MPYSVALWLDVDNTSRRPVPAKDSDVGRLPAALRVAGRFLEEDVGPLRVAGDRKDLAHDGVCFQPVVADEPARPASERGGETARGDPAAITLALHQRADRFEIDGDPALLGKLGGELNGKAERVMQVEHVLRVKRSALQQRLQALHSLAQGDAEALLFRSHGFGNPVSLRFDLGVNRS